MKNKFLKIFVGSSLILSLFMMGFQIISFDEPEFSLKDYQIEDGFELSLIATEPFLKAP